MKTIRNISIIACFIFLLGFFQNVNASLISPITATTSDPIAYTSFGSSVNNVIDGIIDYDYYLALGYEGFGLFTGPYTVRFDLGNSYDLTGFQLWNNAGNIEDDGEGVDSFTLNFYDSSLTSKGSFSNNAEDILASQYFDFAISDVKVVDFIIYSSHSVGGPMERQYVMFHEIKFDGTPVAPVPEPSTMILISSGLFGIAALRKKIKKN